MSLGGNTMQMSGGAAILIGLLCCASVAAQTPTDPVSAVQPPLAVQPASAAQPPSVVVRIPAGTVIEVELTETLSSQTSRQQQLFGLRTVEPITVDGKAIVPAGALGGGEVIDAAPSAFGGRQGRLILSGRYVEIDGKRARIRGMQITAAGKDRAGAAVAVSLIPYAGVASIFVQGGKVEIPTGARGSARLAEDVDVAAPQAPSGQTQVHQEKETRE
jgi:hypothetical protein